MLQLDAQNIYNDLYVGCGSYGELYELLIALTKQCEEDLEELDEINKGQQKMKVDESLHIAIAIDELLKDTDVYSVVRWTDTEYPWGGKRTNVYQFLDCQGNGLELIEL